MPVKGTPFDKVRHCILYDFAIHWFDILNCFMGDKKAKKIYASWARSRRIVSVTMIVLGVGILIFALSPVYWLVLVGVAGVGVLGAAALFISPVTDAMEVGQGRTVTVWATLAAVVVLLIALLPKTRRHFKSA